MELRMLPRAAYIKCQFPGCSTTFTKNSGRRYCFKCTEKLAEAILANSRNASTAPLPTEPPTPKPRKELPPPTPIQKNTSTGGPPIVGQVRRGHRKLLEAAKRKFAGRARPDANAETEKDESE